MAQGLENLRPIPRLSVQEEVSALVAYTLHKEEWTLILAGCTTFVPMRMLSMRMLSCTELRAERFVRV